MTKEEKERIDYEIEAKRKAKAKDMNEWNKVGCLFLVAFIIIAIFAKFAS